MELLMKQQMLPALFLLFGLFACGGGGGDDDDDTGGGDSSGVKPGAEDFVPPPTNDDKGKPSGATDMSCSAANPCDYWYCQCNDGFVVNSADCRNGFCMDAASSCPVACDYFGHNGWSGIAGGGPKSHDPKQPVSECGEQQGTSDSCWSCVEDACCGLSAACYDNYDCLGYWDCALDCVGDSFCESSCADFYAGGVDDYYDLMQCVSSSCSGAC